MIYHFDVPIYEYKCKSCGREFEELVRRDETPSCPSCRGSDLERLLSLPMVSTAETRKRSLAKAKQAARGVQREKDHEQRLYEIRERKEHGGG
jgi:putative FmdB family regulatory protein